MKYNLHSRPANLGQLFRFGLFSMFAVRFAKIWHLWFVQLTFAQSKVSE